MLSYLLELGEKLELGGKIFFVSSMILSIFQAFFFPLPDEGFFFLPDEGLSRQNVWERSLENSPGFYVMEERRK